MNLLFFLKPKASTVVLKKEFTLRQTLEVMENCRFTTLPIIDKEGNYVGSISEGDLLWYIKDQEKFDLFDAEKIKLTDINRYKDYVPVKVNQSMEELVNVSVQQNFVPIVDDRDKFIGIITRQDIIKYFYQRVGALENEHRTQN